MGLRGERAVRPLNYLFSRTVVPCMKLWCLTNLHEQWWGLGCVSGNLLSLKRWLDLVSFIKHSSDRPHGMMNQSYLDRGFLTLSHALWNGLSEVMALLKTTTNPNASTSQKINHVALSRDAVIFIKGAHAHSLMDTETQPPVLKCYSIDPMCPLKARQLI